MTSRSNPLPAYKDITLQQLRSFCETARRGSLSAAATALDLAHPTVWKQVHALEKAYGVPLIEPHARGCRLTAAGETFLALVSPSVDSLTTIRDRFTVSRRDAEVRIVVGGPSAFLAENVCPALKAFVAKWPGARITLEEIRIDSIARAILRGDVHLAFTSNVEAGRDFSRLYVEPWYELDVTLLTPRKHPLATRRKLRIEHLKEFPLVNSTDTLRDPVVHSLLVKHGLFQTQPRHVEARTSTTIRRCVAAGLGIGLVSQSLNRKPDPELHERAVSDLFGRTQVYLVRPTGTYRHPAVEDLATEVRNACRRIVPS